MPTKSQISNVKNTDPAWKEHYLMYPVHINGQSTNPENGGKYHVTLRNLGENQPDLKQMEHHLNQLNTTPPDQFQLVPHQFNTKEGKTWHVLKLVGPGIKHMEDANKKLQDHYGPDKFPTFQPHITVDKDLWDKVKAGMPQHKLNVNIKPLELWKEDKVLWSDKQPTANGYKIAKGEVEWRNLFKADAFKAPTPTQPDIKIRSVANNYAKSKGLTLNHPTHQAEVNMPRAKNIAAAYEAMPHNPEHPEVKRAYNALINETADQFHHIKNAGLKISKIKSGMANPYQSSKDMLQDVRNNNHMWYYPTEQGFGSSGSLYGNHPMLKPSGVIHNGEDLPANDLFRIVHDYFGHAKEGYGFGPKGEENAYLSHKQMYSPQAQKALTSETRGQNSWVNFGKHSEHNRANPSQTVYADQKAGLLPDWALDTEETKKSEPTKKDKLKAIEIVRKNTEISKIETLSQPYDTLLEEGLDKTMKNKALNVITAMSMLGAPTALSSQDKSQPGIQVVDTAKGDLDAIKNIESSNGKNLNHAEVVHGVNNGTKAIGSYGLMPITIVETAQKNPHIKKLYPQLGTLDPKMDQEKISQMVLGNKKMEEQLVNAHWHRLLNRFGNDHEKAAYAWYNGITHTLDASPEDIKKHPYVQKFNKYKKLGNFAMNNERVPASIKSEKHDVKPAQNVLIDDKNVMMNATHNWNK